MERRTTVIGAERLASWHLSPREPSPTVVCVHGAGVSSRELRPLVSELGLAVDAWTVDLPGFGYSTKPAAAPDLRSLVDALSAWLDAEGLAPACLLGGSFGCQIVVDLAVRHPEQVSHLVLAGPTVDPHGRTWPRMLGRWLRNAVHEDPRMLPLNIADYRDAGARRVISAFRASKDDRIEDKLERIAVPTLVARGELDALCPQDWAEEVTRLLPRGRLAIVPRTPHMIPYRAPGELSSLVTDFLESDAAA